MSLSTSAPAVSRATPRTRANRARASPSPRASSPRAMDVVSTTLIVDDLVFHDGSTVMERLGGGGPQTLFGALCHRDGASARVGIVAGVGEDDCPESSRRWLVERGVDVDGLLAVSGASTPRAWQITERDGRRTQVWREEASEGLYAMLRPEFASWPEKCRRTRAVHFGINPARPDVALVGALRNAGCGLISIEPFTHAPTPLSASALRELMSLGDVWSPNERESKSFFADGETMSPEELVGRMRDAGRIKSFVFDEARSERWRTMQELVRGTRAKRFPCLAWWTKQVAAIAFAERSRRASWPATVCATPSRWRRPRRASWWSTSAYRTDRSTSTERWRRLARGRWTRR